MCEEVCTYKDIFEDGLQLMEGRTKPEDIQEMAQNSELISQLEQRVKNWGKKVQEVFPHFLQVYWTFF